MTHHWNMKKFQFHITYEQCDTVVVEAETVEEARDLIAEGEYTDEQVIDKNIDYVDLSDGMEVK